MSTIPPSSPRSTFEPHLSGSVITSTTTPVNSEPLTREAQIEEAAYYRAERRGFAPAGELSDWLAAEREIDTLRARKLIA